MLIQNIHKTKYFLDYTIRQQIYLHRYQGSLRKSFMQVKQINCIWMTVDFMHDLFLSTLGLKKSAKEIQNQSRFSQVLILVSKNLPTKPHSQRTFIQKRTFIRNSFRKQTSENEFSQYPYSPFIQSNHTLAHHAILRKLDSYVALVYTSFKE